MIFLRHIVVIFPVLCCLSFGHEKQALWRRNPGYNFGKPSSEHTGLCHLYRETLAGPFHHKTIKIYRKKISKGLAGIPLDLRIRVQHYKTCRPLSNVTVDLWHADFKGFYSGYGERSGENYGRGIQVTDMNGTVNFLTIFPGWYTGRSIHIHVEFFYKNELRHVDHLYFPESVTHAVKRKKPYSKRFTKPLPHSLDITFIQQGGNYSILNVTGSVRKVLYATKTININPNKKVKEDANPYPNPLNP